MKTIAMATWRPNTAECDADAMLGRAMEGLMAGCRPEERAALALIGGRLAACLRLADREAGDLPPERLGVQPARSGAPFRVKLFAYDDSLFIDDAYIIKGVPGRLLFHFLRLYAESGRCDFTNREVRLETALRLPDLKDNLETRLILLRRRLEERQAPVRLARPGRGQIRLEVEGSPHLELVADFNRLRSAG